MEYDTVDFDALEPGQLADAKRERLPRARLSRPVLALLIVLRIYVLLAVPLVAYAFVRAIMAGAS